jgi:hypothetical protein
MASSIYLVFKIDGQIHQMTIQSRKDRVSIRPCVVLLGNDKGESSQPFVQCLIREGLDT